MTKTLEIRPSTVTSMQLCPARTMLRGEPEFNVIPNEPLPFGSLVHWYIEQHLAMTIPTKAEARSELARIFYKDSSKKLSEYASDAVIDALISEAIIAVEAWVDQIQPHLPDEEPIVERKLRTVIGGVPGVDVELFGTPDAIYPKAKLIVDWKTAGKQWDKKKVEGQLQPIAYPLLVGEELGLDIEEFAFCVYARDSELWHIHNIRLVDVDRRREAFVDLTIGYALMIDSHVPVFTPGGQAFHSTRGWHCSPKYCDAWGACSGKYLIADGKAQQPALEDNERGWS